MFDNLAKDFLEISPSTLAFNYLNSAYTISRVFPLHKNRKALGKNLLKHPDLEIEKLFKKGLDKDHIVLTPPVELYQGHKAIIFYAPIIFKDQSYGWINVLIQIDKTFQNFMQVNAPLNSHISIRDQETGRFLFQEKRFGKLPISDELKLLNRTILFHNDISESVILLKEKYLKQLGFILCLIVLLCVTLFYYFKSNEKIIESLTSAKSEKNLLRILFHDLTNPLSIVQLYGLSLQEKYPEDPEVPKQLIKIQQMIEIITSIRHLDYLNREIAEIKTVSFEMSELFENLILLNKDIINKKNLSIKIDDNNQISKDLKIPYELFKNEIVNNLFNNSLKFSFENEIIYIEIKEDHLKITNKSSPIPKKVLKDINQVRPTESRTEGIVGKGHGLGIFIAKILAKKFEIKLQITQDADKQEVYTYLFF